MSIFNIPTCPKFVDYCTVAVVDLDTFGLYNVKRKSEFDGGKKGE